MATETAPPPSLEAQQHEEYIDYSEDDSAAPAVAAEDSNNNLFSSNVQFDADALENTEMLPSESDHRAQAVDMQADADIASISVVADVKLNGDDADFVPIVDAETARQIDGTETEGGYFEETDNLSAANIMEAEGAYINENEISWEDGPSNEQDTDQDGSHVKLDHDDWQLVDEADQVAQDTTNLNEASFEQGEVESHEIEQALEDPPNAFSNLDTDLEATTVVDVGPASEGQQAAGTQDSEADEDVNEIDYPENENGDSAADVSADVSDAQLERLDAVQEGLGDAPSEHDTEDHAMEEDHESQLGQEVESNIATDDDVNDEQQNGEVTDVPDYAAPGEATSDEHVEYDDEMLADARSSISAETPSNDNMDIPVITVSYKGIDYPFFYGSPDSEGKECFFNDLSLLHCKMEGVLAGFRRELANELGPFDELVFQIDELGLEFAEIISVFDSLVKNQNPNASKPLYAYLSTRPNCKKRWLSLVDDAYNGKGLDEISFYFASRAQSEAPEIMDDEPDLIGEEDNADAAAWPQSPGESERDDQNDDETQGETAETNEDINEYDDVGDGTAGDDDAVSQDAINEDPIQPEASAIEDLGAEATGVDNEGVLIDESTVAVDIGTVEDAGVVDMAEDQQPEHHEENEVDTSNPLVWDAEEADAPNTVEDAQTFTEDEDLTHRLNQIVEGVDVDSADKVTPNTSATSTLNGDEEAAYDNELDLNADLPENEIGGTEVHGQDDELAEIDWREFPGQDDDVAKSPSISGKRQRSDVDDMLDDEAQKDVKRRRS
ncbi:conserved glutamic acid-rich protein [Colletotrichum tofieldiae]|nr:conserved glutamic acid-rich protein [Colletotrichum tofieldiae]GKT73100.1 conserved glutamic acid-rich protein [Colletotrichum tofieldiae]